jgi:SAM-dependent methyltransferase
VSTDFGAAFWDEKYRGRTAPWSSETNDRLIAMGTAGVPGDVLDVGCGEGADAIALAARGWRVTAVDISEVALARGRAHDTTGRVVWVCADLLAYLHFPSPARERVFGALARAVRSGGTLLFVAHDVSDLETTVGRWPEREVYATPAELAALLEPHAWDIVEAASVPRPAHDREGNAVTVRDVVVHARKR